MIDGLKPYAEYKDSGVPWLGEVPAHWEIKPLKHLADINARVLPESTDPDYHFDYLDIGSVSTGFLAGKPQRIRFGDAPSRARRLLKRGDTIISTVRTYLKAVYFVPAEVENLVASTGFAVLTPSPGIEPECLSYVLQSEPFINRVCADSVGTAYPAIAESRLGSFAIALPSFPEQRAIARFLDHHDRLTRRYIRTQRRLIELLTEQKQAIIHQAVTRGLDPDVPLKDSGVEWLGKIPMHWEIRRNSRIFLERNNPGRIDLPIMIVSLNSGVTIGEDIDDSGRPRRLIEDRSNYKFAAKGDIAYNMMRMWQGAVGVVPTDGLVSPAYVVARPLAGINSQYFVYLFRIGDYKNEINRKSRGIVSDRNRLYWDEFKNLVSLVPPIEEQDAIVEYIISELAQIDEAITRAQRQIDLVREYRTRLIADVVTGKLDVRGVSPPEPDEAGDLGNLDDLEEDGELDDLDAEELDDADD